VAEPAIGARMIRWAMPGRSVSRVCGHMAGAFYVHRALPAVEFRDHPAIAAIGIRQHQRHGPVARVPLGSLGIGEIQQVTAIG